MRRALLVLALFAGPLSAQEEAIPARMSWFPYLLGDPTHGLLVVGHWQITRQADYEARWPHDWYLGSEGAWGTRGSRFLTVKARAPGLIPNWRLAADAGAVREGRFGYYGVGPGGDAGLDPEAFPTDYFRVRRTRYYGRAEVSRTIAGPFFVSVAAGLTRSRFGSVTEESLFNAGGNVPNSTDATGRFTLGVDTRDRELVPARGVLVEAGLFGGTGRFCADPCGSGYGGLYAQARGYGSPRRGIVLAGRAAYRTMGENAPLDARYEFPGWERDLSVYGGFDSNRGYVRGRLVGRRVILTSAEVRYDLVDGGDYGALTLLAFVDGGGVYDGPAGGPMTFSGWKTGVGGGIVIRVLRQAILSLNFARGPNGFNFTSGTGWAF
jgi:hypothetical protein